jgi:hypothetical protein
MAAIFFLQIVQIVGTAVVINTIMLKFFKNIVILSIFVVDLIWR